MVGFRGRRDRELTEEERSAFCGSAMQHRTQISNVYRERAKECRTLAKTGFAQFRADFLRLAETYEQLARQTEASKGSTPHLNLEKNTAA